MTIFFIIKLQFNIFQTRLLSNTKHLSVQKRLLKGQISNYQRPQYCRRFEKQFLKSSLYQIKLLHLTPHRWKLVPCAYRKNLHLTQLLNVHVNVPFVTLFTLVCLKFFKVSYILSSVVIIVFYVLMYIRIYVLCRKRSQCQFFIEKKSNSFFSLSRIATGWKRKGWVR